MRCQALLEIVRGHPNYHRHPIRQRRMRMKMQVHHYRRYQHALQASRRPLLLAGGRLCLVQSQLCSTSANCSYFSWRLGEIKPYWIDCYGSLRSASFKPSSPMKRHGRLTTALKRFVLEMTCTKLLTSSKEWHQRWPSRSLSLNFTLHLVEEKEVDTLSQRGGL
jgi:hypothetical protein